ncbi:MAG TPA: four helix bundle protein [Waterburya sp.]|jgi:four helix bundle protein
MMKSNFDNLPVYQLAERLADEIWNIVGSWDEFAQDTIGKQIVRSVDSIGANIAEGTSRNNFQDHQHFVRMAIGSLNETRHWLRRAYTRHLLTTEQVNKLKPILDELTPRLNAYLKSIDPIPEKHESPPMDN